MSADSHRPPNASLPTASSEQSHPLHAQAAADEDAALARIVEQAGQSAPTTAYGGHRDQCYERFGAAPAPVVVFVHGGFFRTTIDRSHARGLAAALARSGFRVILTEYRRTPGDPMTALDDLVALERNLTLSGEVAAHEIRWMGHSAGGFLVLQHALTSQARPAALALAAVSDVRRAVEDQLGDGAVATWMGGGPGEHPRLYEALSPAAWLQRRPSLAERIQLVHGAADCTVPSSYSADFPAASTIVEGAHHYDLIDPASSAWQVVLARLRQLAPA